MEPAQLFTYQALTLEHCFLLRSKREKWDMPWSHTAPPLQCLSMTRQAWFNDKCHFHLPVSLQTVSNSLFFCQLTFVFVSCLDCHLLFYFPSLTNKNPLILKCFLLTSNHSFCCISTAIYKYILSHRKGGMSELDDDV